MRIAWSPRARGHLIALRSYIAERIREPPSPLPVESRLRSTNSRSFHAWAVAEESRARANSSFPVRLYIVAYVVDADEVTILAILHGAQRWPEAF